MTLDEVAEYARSLFMESSRQFDTDLARPDRPA